MNNLFSRTRPALKPLALIAILYCATSAQAFQFKSENGVSGSFDTTISYGISVRAQDADKSLIGLANGGTSRSVNEDDGDRNYKKNDPFANLLKATHDFEVKYKNFGMFLRGTYFVDFENRNNNLLGEEAKKRIGRDALMLDAYLSGQFDVMDGRNLNVRVGHQVVSWGESTFLPNGINVINPVDVSKLRVPGAELKEAFIPSSMIWTSLDVSDTVSLEAFLLNNFDKIKLDPRGSYFSNNDFASDDGWEAHTGFGRRHDRTGRGGGNIVPPTIPGLGATAAAIYGPFDPAASAWLARIADRAPSDHGQFGIKLNYLAKGLNNTQFGLYHINYHSRIPMFSGFRGTPTSVLTGGPLIPTICGTAALSSLCHLGNGVYFAEYPENIRLFGMSFNTAGPFGTAVQGEYSYRPNNPLQLATPEVLLAGLGAPNLITGFTQIPGAPVGATAAALVPTGTYLRGWRPIKTSQAQVTITKAMPNLMGADQLVLLGEFGATKYHDLPSDLKFNGPAVYLPATAFGAAVSGAGSVQETGYLTTFSWGYRLVSRLDFTGGPLGTNISPRVAFAHDVKGVSQTFNEGIKSASLGVNVEYQKKLTLDLSYTSYFGGRVYCGTDTASPGTSLSTQIAIQGASFCSSANPLKDRDFYSVVMTYSF